MSTTKLPSKIIDAHHHFWRYNPDQHVWMTDEMGILKRDYLPADLAPLYPRPPEAVRLWEARGAPPA